MKYCFFLVVFFSIVKTTTAQVNVSFKVNDSLKKPIPDVYVFLNSKVKTTNKNGIVEFSVNRGNYNLTIDHLAYNSYSANFDIQKDSIYFITLKEKKELLQEVVVTAKESNNISTSSVIDKQAMSHIQPSSFADLVSLLPGKNISRPNLNSSNHFRIRETGVSDGDYDVSSLGVSFLIDDMPINTNANFQETIGVGFSITPNRPKVDDRRRSVRKGVDMRSITTDGIEKVEIVRGVASAKYGDLSSGLVKITRKNGYTKWKSRVKSDGFSKLFYLGKGYNFNDQNLKLNFDLGYLDAVSDPRNSLENYERYNASLRLEKKFNSSNPITWNANIDFTGTLDDERTDPEIGFDASDFYKSSYNNIRFSSQFNIDFPEKILNNLNFRINVSQSYDKIEQRKRVQITRSTSLPITREEGEGYGIFLESSYVSNLIIDGKPLDIFSDISTTMRFSVLKLKHELTTGLNYTYAKNNGLGQVYDPLRPLTRISIRPRSFKDIPAMQTIAFYLEDVIKWNLEDTFFTLRAGLRGNSMVGLNNSYEINEKLFFDPRLNFKVQLPKIIVNKKALKIDLTAGYGEHNKLPTQNMLFPQNLYADYEQLNYFNNNPDLRQVHYRTYIFPQINYRIKPALNIKKELRLGVNYDYHSFYATFFNETMVSGFRKQEDLHAISYRQYDASGLDHNNITEAPLVENLPFTVINGQVLSAQESNGTAIRKKGIEFQYSSKRFKTINTRFTLNGAWLKTKYYNSLPFKKKAERNVIGGVTHYNIGIYNSDDNYLKESMRASFTADTYFQKIGLTTSFRTDFNLLSTSTSYSKSSIPIAYINESGVTLPYTSVEANDPILQSLIIRSVSDRGFVRRAPFSLNTHLKVSKQFYKYFTMSMYVNNLFNYSSINSAAGRAVTQRNLVDPYFGMEMNINF